jgi:hypothetical protein
MSAQSDTTTSSTHATANRRAGLLIAVVMSTALGLSWTAMADQPTPVTDAAAVVDVANAATPLTLASAAPDTLLVETTVLDPSMTTMTVAALPTGAESATMTPAPAAAPAPATAGPTPAPPAAAPVTTSPPTAGPTIAPATAPAATIAVTAPPATAAPTSAPQVTAPPTTAAPATAPPTTTPATAPPTTSAAPTLYRYDFAGVASEIVIAQYADRHIELYSMTRLPGWVSQVASNGPSNVEIHFFNTATQDEAQFTVERDGSRLKVSKEN